MTVPATACPSAPRTPIRTAWMEEGSQMIASIVVVLIAVWATVRSYRGHKRIHPEAAAWRSVPSQDDGRDIR
jgi:hypothetical protein